VTEENPHKINLWTKYANSSEHHTLECAAEGCNWKIPTNAEMSGHARAAAQEHIDMWALRQANAGHAALIAKLGKEKAELTAELEDRIKKLEADSRMLAALEAGGVDNWVGYEAALEEMEEDG